MKNLTPIDLQDYLREADPPPLLLDVREPWEYQRVRLPNSTLIPMRQIPAALPSLDEAQEIVVVCHYGVRSRQVAYFLEHHGFARIVNLHGGIDAWAREVDPAMPLY
jgi:rhodanese-related sulfurtransferase